MRIQHNIMAMNAYRNYNTNTSALSKNLEKLSSGYKINRAGDDAAGLAISEKMRAQITGLNAAQKNVKDGISLVKTAEGAMQEIQDMLNRMDYLATQSANGTYDNEVDRLNLQKEVDALKSEINRIADSANFNGIKLLDGKAGINTSAFSFESVDAIKASNGEIELPDSLFSAEDAGPTQTHLEKAGVTTQTPPTFTIDLNDLALKATANGTAKINVLGKDFDIALTATGGTNGDGNYTASDLATALKTEIQKDANLGVKADGAHDTTTTNNTSLKYGGMLFTVGGTAEKITLTYAGVYKADGTLDASTDFTEAQAKTINDAIGQGVSLSDAGGAAQTGDVKHNTTDVTYAIAKSPTTMAGIDFKLTSDIVKEGNKLIIDGTEYTFKTEATSTLTGANVIDVSKGKTDAEKIHMAVDALSTKTTDPKDNRTFKIESKGPDTIHIDQITASNSGKEIDTYDKLKGLISVKGQPVTAKAAGVTINVTPDKISAGNTLNIDGKTYTFVDGATNAAKNEISKDSAVADLASALGTDYSVTVDGNKITVRGKTATDGAPVITGEGLTLQIGDTSDSYNQLKVKIGDMHVNAMGTKNGASIADITIADQEGAAAAVQTIKDAINYVSGIRGDLGAVQNRLEHTQNNLSVMAENIQDAESTIRDTDVAEEMMSYVKNNILVQSAQAMLAQANQVPQGVLQLLG